MADRIKRALIVAAIVAYIAFGLWLSTPTADEIHHFKEMGGHG